MNFETPSLKPSVEEPKKIKEITIESLSVETSGLHKSAESKVDDFKQALANLGFKVECDSKNHGEIKISY